VKLVKSRFFLGLLEIWIVRDVSDLFHQYEASGLATAGAVREESVFAQP
jgi:hypothetical protein